MGMTLSSRPWKMRVGAEPPCLRGVARSSLGYARPSMRHATTRNGYAWWYLDALSDDGAHGLTIILFIGGTPIVWAGPLSNWIAACDLMLGLDAHTVVLHVQRQRTAFGADGDAQPAGARGGKPCTRCKPM